MTTLINTFHGSKYHTKKSPEEVDRIVSTAPWERTEAEKAFVRRARKALCGVDGCTCGDEIGRREK